MQSVSSTAWVTNDIKPSFRVRFSPDLHPTSTCEDHTHLQQLYRGGHVFVMCVCVCERVMFVWYRHSSIQTFVWTRVPQAPACPTDLPNDHVLFFEAVAGCAVFAGKHRDREVAVSRLVGQHGHGEVVDVVATVGSQSSGCRGWAAVLHEVAAGVDQQGFTPRWWIVHIEVVSTSQRQIQWGYLYNE